jgi:hypothetical protein
MGDTTMRFGSVRAPISIGENNALIGNGLLDENEVTGHVTRG